MPLIQINTVETVKQGVNSDLFGPIGDPITLRITASFSSALLNISNPQAWSHYQILEFGTNAVLEQWTFDISVMPGVVQWVNLPTAQGLGLKWLPNNIFGFRAAIQGFTNSLSDGLEAVEDALAVSEVRWFRIEPDALL